VSHLSVTKERRSVHLQTVSSRFNVVCTVHCTVTFSQNQQMQKISDKYKMYLQPLHMFRQTNCHPQGIFIKELQVLIAYKYAIVGFTLEVFTQLTILTYIDALNYKIKN
jgi:hypothetical protein